MYEDLTFEDALEAEDERAQANWRWGYQYLGHSRYYEQVKRYFDRFERKQILVCLFDRRESEPEVLVSAHESPDGLAWSPVRVEVMR